MKKPIVLPADVYDFLELSALAFGGIGGGRYRMSSDPVSPYCVLGHAGASSYDPDHEVLRAVRVALSRAFGDTAGGTTEVIGANDTVVPEGKRLSWSTYCRKLQIVRGQ